MTMIMTPLPSLGHALCDKGSIQGNLKWNGEFEMGGVLPYMGYIGMCRCEGYGFQAVYSRIG